MIYLIGGPPKCGKTTFAKQLSKSAGIPWVSTDTLQNAIKPYVAEQEYAIKFPTSAMRFESNDEKYTTHSSGEIISAYRKQAKTLSSAIEAFVASEITDGNDHVIEGYHLEPELINRVALKFPEKIRSIMVIKKDPAAFVESIHKSTTPNDWIRERTRNDSTFSKIAKMITEYSTQLENEAKQRNIKIFCVDQNFDTELKAAVGYLISH